MEALADGCGFAKISLTEKALERGVGGFALERNLEEEQERLRVGGEERNERERERRTEKKEKARKKKMQAT